MAHDKQKAARYRETVMIAYAGSLPITSQFPLIADEAKPSLGARWLRSIMAGQQRKADREILQYSSILCGSHREAFGLELERRILGQ
jgi:hypothetical protein